MTTDAGLPSVRKSLQLALMAEPEGSPLVAEQAEADHYHLNYSKHPVPVLFRDVRAARTLLAGVLPAVPDGTELYRRLGGLSDREHVLARIDDWLGDEDPAALIDGLLRVWRQTAAAGLGLSSARIWF
ncbi:hypothetical protein [Streptomyces sp. NPDC050287]|uniref:hypothetical protein n=1 Tax=Streptomyces sp. NPDC050287 TaxID=3365608 RepID=UPI00378BEC7A